LFLKVRQNLQPKKSIVSTLSTSVKKIKDRGEADGTERRVDDPVDDSIELFAEKIEGPGDGEALEELFAERGADHGRDEIARGLAEA